MTSSYSKSPYGKMRDRIAERERKNPKPEKEFKGVSWVTPTDTTNLDKKNMLLKMQEMF